MLHSVRARLTLWYTAILALVLIAFSAIAYLFLAREIRAATDRSLGNTAQEFAAAFSNDPAVPAEGSVVLLDFRGSEEELAVFSADGTIVASSRPVWENAGRDQIAALVRKGATGVATVRGGANGDGIRFVALPIDVMGNRYTAVVARDLDEQAGRLRSAARALFSGIPLALLFAAGGGYVLARKSLAPVTSMSTKARQISVETLDERIVVANERDELGFLAMTLNDLLERLQRSFDSQRHFMADASHELRTPVSIIQGEADVALARERTPEEYRESIGVMQSAARGLTRVVQNLFLLVRTDAGNYPILRSRFYVDEVIASCVRSMRSVAEAKGIELTCQASSEPVIVADEDLVHRMLLNLIDNAVKFTPNGGRVVIQSQRSDQGVTIDVHDSGPGIASEDQARIFERFFRGERTRRGPARGAGLGLPIARWIAEAHGGSLVLLESNAQGTTFRLTLPAEPGW